MNFKPFNERVLIKQDAAVDKIGGIYIPPNVKEKPQFGTIMAVSHSSKLKVGSRVLFGKYSGTQVKFEENDYLIMKEEDILGFINE